MADAKPKVRPKSETFEHAGQKYTCTFDPNAPKDQCWVWTVKYVQTFHYSGSCPTMDAAASRARRRIHMMNVRNQSMDEKG